MSPFIYIGIIISVVCLGVGLAYDALIRCCQTRQLHKSKEKGESEPCKKDSTEDASADKILTPKLHDYAWTWFSYHAKQRLDAFNYFIIFLGLLLTALTFGINRYPELSSGIALIAAVISFAFLNFEYRNEELVNIGKNALLALEKNYPPEYRLHHNNNPVKTVTHGWWLKIIYWLIIILFLTLFWAFAFDSFLMPG